MNAIGSSSTENHTIRNTAIIASAGAVTGAGLSAYYQNHLLQNKTDADKFVKTTTQNREALIKSGKEPAKLLETFQDAFMAVVKNNKFDSKLVQKAGAYGAATFGGAYLAYKGLTSLFKN